MSVRDYIKSIIGEFIILGVTTWALTYTVETGFITGDGYLANPVLLIVLVAAMLVVFYAVSYNKRTVVIGIPLCIAAVVVVLIACVVASGGKNVFEDAEGNLFLFVAIAIITGSLCFLLSRARWGTIALAVVGALTCCFLEFMYEEYHAVQLVVFVLGAAALIIYQQYRRGLKGTDSVRSSFGSATGLAVGAAAVVALLGVGIFFVVVAPLNPPAQEIKLFTEYLALEELPRRGTNSELAITDPDLTSTLTNQDPEQAQQDEDQEDQQDADQSEGTQMDPTSSAMQSVGQAVGYAAESTAQTFNLITHNMKPWQWVLLIILLILLLLSPFFIKLWKRRSFYKAALESPPRDYVTQLYQRFVRDFDRMGIARSPQATPYEYAFNNEKNFRDFSVNDANASFALITVIFMKASFGRDAITASDLVACDCFYHSFFRNCREHVGWMRYARLFFKL